MFEHDSSSTEEMAADPTRNEYSNEVILGSFKEEFRSLFLK